jgi:transcriptional regulator with XRE-family HTH domain
MSNFAENLKNLRKEKNLTQSDLAEKLFTSPQTISRWESGDGEPSLDLLISLTEILDVSADRLISGKSVPEPELFDGIAQYIADMPAETADRDGFRLFRQILNGFCRRYFPDSTAGEHPTYSTLHAGDLHGFYADREETPRIFAMYDSLSGESDAAAQANLPEIFAALSDEAVIRAVLKLSEIPYRRMYDAESLADVLTVPETEIAKITEALKTLGQLAESAIPYNGETVTVYTRVSKQNVRMLLSLTRLLYRCGTDGNM